MKVTYKKLRNAAGFIVVSMLLLAAVSAVLERKTLNGAWNYQAKMNEFYALDVNSLDYICLGSSHAYCTVNPLEVWNENGLTGFVLATQQQPLRATYYYLKEALKTQSPKAVLLEGFMAGRTEVDEAVLYDAVDPLRFSANKMQMIWALTEPEMRSRFYFNIIKYHSRWKELSLGEIKQAFSEEKDMYKGFVCLDEAKAAENKIPEYEEFKTGEIPQENLEAMNDILKLTQECGSELVLLIGPYDAYDKELVSMIKAEKAWAMENEVEIIDCTLMLEELGIDPSCDYYDANHLNRFGAAKSSSYVAECLADMGIVPGNLADNEMWRQDYEKYMNR